MIITYYKIRCDNSTCLSSFEGHTLKRAAMAGAKALGWRFRLSFWGYSHICPRCIAAAKEPTP